MRQEKEEEEEMMIGFLAGVVLEVDAITDNTLSWGSVSPKMPKFAAYVLGTWRRS